MHFHREADTGHHYAGALDDTSEGMLNKMKVFLLFAPLQTCSGRAPLQGDAGQQRAVLSVVRKVPVSQQAGGPLQKELCLQAESDIPAGDARTGRKPVGEESPAAKGNW